MTEEAIIREAKAEVERKHFIEEMDDVLKDLQEWKAARAQK